MLTSGIRCLARGHRRMRSTKDRDRRIVSTLLRRTRQHLRFGIIAMLDATRREIVLELGIDEPVEDRQQLRGHQPVTTGHREVDRTTDFDQTSITTLHRHIDLAMRTIGISTQHDTLHHDPEIVERQLASSLNQQRHELAEPLSNTHVAVHLGQLEHLRPTDATGEQRVAHVGMPVDQPGQAAHRGDLVIRPRTRRTQIALHRAMTIEGVQPPRISDRNSTRHPRRVGPTPQLELANRRIQTLVGQPDQILDRIAEHHTSITNTRSSATALK